MYFILKTIEIPSNGSLQQTIRDIQPFTNYSIAAYTVITTYDGGIEKSDCTWKKFSTLFKDAEGAEYFPAVNCDVPDYISFKAIENPGVSKPHYCKQATCIRLCSHRKPKLSPCHKYLRIAQRQGVELRVVRH